MPSWRACWCLWGQSRWVSCRWWRCQWVISPNKTAVSYVSTVGPCGLHCIKMVLEKKGADDCLIPSSDSHSQSLRSSALVEHIILWNLSLKFTCVHIPILFLKSHFTCDNFSEFQIISYFVLFFWSSHIVTILMLILVSTGHMQQLLVLCCRVLSNDRVWCFRSELVTSGVKDGDRHHPMSAIGKFTLHSLLQVVFRVMPGQWKCKLPRECYISEQNEGPTFTLVLD